MENKLDSYNISVDSNNSDINTTNNILSEITYFETNNNSILYQNTPNPFNTETSIKHYIPNNVIDAKLYVYDLTGKQLLNTNIFDRGTNEYIIKAEQLDAGMYIYSLITDGQLVDSRQMILID